MNKIEKMKKEYNEIEIPAELKKKTLDGIRQGKNKGLKKNAFRIVKYSGVSVAAAMLTIVLLANSSQPLAYAMEKIPVIGTITKVITFRTYTDKTKDFEANINVPQIQSDISNNTTSKAADKVNKSIEEYTNMLIEQYNNDLQASEGEGYYGMDSSYEIVTDNEKIFTLRIDTTVVMAGANSSAKFYHINKETDEVITLKDLFMEDANYITVISENIKTQMKEQMERDEKISYFLDSDVPEWNFKEIKPDQNFYFNESEDLVIVFDEYEVAPGYMGIVEITVPKEDIVDILK